MSDILNQLKQGAEKLINNAEKISKTAVKKTKDTIDQTKLKYTVSETEDKIKDILAEMGERIYTEYKNGRELDEDLSEKCRLVKSLYEEINDLKAKIAELNDSVVCPVCGSMMSKEACFCPKCGNKRTYGDEAQEENIVETVETVEAEDDQEL